MRNTINYNLPIYDKTDKFAIEDFNRTNTKVDKAIGDLQDSINDINNGAVTTIQEVIDARGEDVNLSARFIKNEEEIKKNKDDLVITNEHLADYMKHFSINAVTQLGLDNTGVEEIGTKLQTYINNSISSKINIYFPNGTYLWNETVTSNKILNLTGEMSNVLVSNTGTLASLKNRGSCTINGLIFATSSFNRTEFTVYSTSASEFFIHDTTFTCNSGKINGLQIETTVISRIDRCKFNHSQISLKTWDCKITNTWVWTLWRPYGIGVHGGCGNITISNVDVVPPFRTDSGIKNSTVIEGQKAGIWINSLNGSPTNNIILENIYFDGNPTLDTGIGLLCENVFGVTLSSYRANKLNSHAVVIDTSYDVIISKGMNFENNKYDQEAHDILVKKSGTGKMDSIHIDSCHCINYVTSGITKPTSAIKVDTSANGTTKITNNFIGQSGNGHAYGNKEIDVINIPKMIYTNSGTKTSYVASGSFVINGTSTTLNLIKPLAYLPKQIDYKLSCENGYLPNYRVQQINEYQAFIEFSSTVNATVYYDIKLGK